MRRDSKERPSILPVSLQDVYVQPGRYSAKLMIDPELSPEINDVDVSIRNADGSPFDFTYRRWGTKLNVTFLIDDGTPDGVATVDVSMTGRSRNIQKRFCFWIVK